MVVAEAESINSLIEMGLDILSKDGIAIESPKDMTSGDRGDQGCRILSMTAP